MKLLRENGYMNWVLPLMLGFAAVDVLLSGRDLSMVFAELAGMAQGSRSALMPWLQRALSVVLLLISIERIAYHFGHRRPVPSLPLAWTYVAYWACTVASPALLGAHKQVSHEYTYALVIGFAALLVTTQEIGKVVDTVRSTLFALLLLSVVLVPLWPTLVLDESYTQGLLPGVPRLGGVAPHPVAMGMYAQMALLLLWARPYGTKWVNVMAWVLGLGVLFFAQSKTAWIAFMLCSMTMFTIRNAPTMWKRLSDPREGAFGIAVCLMVMVAGAAVLALALFADIGGVVKGFLDTDQGAQLMTMTGRDQIWAVAWEQWSSHKLFGYGPGLFDDEFRMAIGMPNATNAHNQFMDTLARSGSVGALALVAYSLVLLGLSLKYARRTGGLSVALFIALALRAMSEVPLMLFGYGIELVGHLLLVVTLSAAASMNVPQPAPRARPAYGVPA
ncbi:O-antigen ligase family protein [Ramlibacter sp. PS4R-6]|uniref:O-antigen ligase family protein n=1 Tax=Ramlibacter sp. PS4R-6 TaxID=3133438 RepID=UPI0030A5DD58